MTVFEDRHERLGDVCASVSTFNVLLTTPREESLLVGGPRSSSRSLLMSSDNCSPLYVIVVWGHTLAKKCYRNPLMGAHRAGALRLVSLYGTVSVPVILVIAGVIMLHGGRQFTAGYWGQAGQLSTEERGRSFAELRGR